MAVTVREKVKGSGEWWIFINHQGKRRSKKIGDKRAANNVAREVEARLAMGDMGMLKEKCPTVANYGQKWLGSPLRGQAESTLMQYKDTFKLRIKPYFGSKRLDEIKKRHIKDFISELKGKDLAAGRCQFILSILSSIFENAIEDELIDLNPCQRAQKYCGKNEPEEVAPLTSIEVQETLENASGLRFEAYTAYLVTVRTGLRIGELLALEWSDIDFDARTVEVSKTYRYHLKKTGPPKNNKTRTVDLTPACVEALRKLRSQRKVVSISGLVFTNAKGKRLSHKYLPRTLKKIAPRPIRFHDLRHTYATLRIAKGDNIVDVSKQLGHHKVAFTLDKYAHWMPGEHKAQVDELDTLHFSAPCTHPGEIEEGK
jgi:integrase